MQKGNIILKADFSGDIRRVSMPLQFTLLELRAKLHAIYNIPVENLLQIKYVDDENDLVTLDSEDELREALRQCKANAYVLRIYTNIMEKKKIDEALTSSLSRGLFTSQLPLTSSMLARVSASAATSAPSTAAVAPAVSSSAVVAPVASAPAVASVAPTVAPAPAAPRVTAIAEIPKASHAVTLLPNPAPMMAALVVAAPSSAPAPAPAPTPAPTPAAPVSAVTTSAPVSVSIGSPTVVDSSNTPPPNPPGIPARRSYVKISERTAELVELTSLRCASLAAEIENKTSDLADATARLCTEVSQKTANAPFQSQDSNVKKYQELSSEAAARVSQLSEEISARCKMLADEMASRKAASLVDVSIPPVDAQLTNKLSNLSDETSSRVSDIASEFAQRLMNL